MKSKQPFSLSKRLKSFAHAFNGIKLIWRNEHNFRIHIALFMVACLLGFYLNIASSEWISIALVSGLVLITELINTCIEHICDFISPQIHPSIKAIKDIAAAAVLIAALTALVTGIIVFTPYLIKLV